MEVLSVNSISVSYGEGTDTVISDVSFKLNSGEVLVLFGKSGSGKTTLLKTIAGLIQPNSGSIFLEEEKLEGPKDKLVPGHEDIKLVFQDFSLKNKMTVAENIHYSLLAYNEDYRSERVTDLIELCGLQDVKESFPEHISGGQKQRLALARALANEPKVLLMDEPFSNLDSITKGILFQEIKSIVKKTNTSVVFVSHDARDALSFANQILVLESGKVSQVAQPFEIYNNPKSKSVALLFGDLNEIDGKFYRLENVRISEDSDIKGTVIEIMYFGSHQLLILKTPTEFIKVFDFENNFRLNDQISVTIDTKKALSW